MLSPSGADIEQQDKKQGPLLVCRNTFLDFTLYEDEVDTNHSRASGRRARSADSGLEASGWRQGQYARLMPLCVPLLEDPKVCTMSVDASGQGLPKVGLELVRLNQTGRQGFCFDLTEEIEAMDGFPSSHQLSISHDAHADDYGERARLSPKIDSMANSPAHSCCSSCNYQTATGSSESSQGCSDLDTMNMLSCKDRTDSGSNGSSDQGSTEGAHCSPSDGGEDAQRDLMGAKGDEAEDPCQFDRSADPFQAKFGEGAVAHRTATRHVASVHGAEHGATVMIRNIACRYTDLDIVAILDEAGFQETYDVGSLYMPMSLSPKPSNLGYAFLHFYDEFHAELCRTVFTGKKFGGSNTTKLCEVSRARYQQSAPGDSQPMQPAWGQQQERCCDMPSRCDTPIQCAGVPSSGATQLRFPSVPHGRWLMPAVPPR